MINMLTNFYIFLIMINFWTVLRFKGSVKKKMNLEELYIQNLYYLRKKFIKISKSNFIHRQNDLLIQNNHHG